MLTFEELYAFVQKRCKPGVVIQDIASHPKAVKIPGEDLVIVCRALYEDPAAYFDSLSCITGIDNGAQNGTMEVAYNLYSIPYNHHLMVKVQLPRENPTIDSVSHIWKTADWHERELFDMFGIIVKNHPDHRRILMPADWEGYPLRKDYVQQTYYRNIKIEY